MGDPFPGRPTQAGIPPARFGAGQRIPESDAPAGDGVVN